MGPAQGEPQTAAKRRGWLRLTAGKWQSKNFISETEQSESPETESERAVKISRSILEQVCIKNQIQTYFYARVSQYFFTDVLSDERQLYRTNLSFSQTIT